MILNNIHGEGFEEDNPELVKEYREAMELEAIAERIDKLIEQKELKTQPDKTDTL